MTLGAALLMIILLDYYAKWQMSSLASHFAKVPVQELAKCFDAQPLMKTRLFPLLLLFMLAICLILEVFPSLVLAVATVFAVGAYCAVLFYGWMRIIKTSQQANGS